MGLFNLQHSDLEIKNSSQKVDYIKEKILNSIENTFKSIKDKDEYKLADE